MHLENVTVLVADYEAAIAFYVDTLGFTLIEDSPALTDDGRTKRWVVVRPPGGQTGLLLARADGPHQSEMVGGQFAGRVGLFLRVDDCGASYRTLCERGVVFLQAPERRPYGEVAVFVDLHGNRWDLLGP